MLGLVLENEKPKDFLVIPEVWNVIDLFCRVQTQWRCTSGVMYGLDYNAVRYFIELLEIKNPITIFEDLQVIEGKIVEILSRERK